MVGREFGFGTALCQKRKKKKEKVNSDCWDHSCMCQRNEVEIKYY